MAASIADEFFSFVPARHRRAALVSTAAAAALGLLLLVAYLFIQYVVDTRNENVSNLIWELGNELSGESDLDAASAVLGEIKDAGTDEQYAIAAMRLAASYYADEQFEQAETLYTDIIESAEHKGMRDTARIRLAKVWFEQGEFERASSLLLQVETRIAHFDAVVSVLLGDIRIAENRLEEAETLYGEALTKLEALQDNSKISFVQNRISMLASLKLQNASSGSSSDSVSVGEASEGEESSQ